MLSNKPHAVQELSVFGVGDKVPRKLHYVVMHCRRRKASCLILRRPKDDPKEFESAWSHDGAAAESRLQRFVDDHQAFIGRGDRYGFLAAEWS